MISVRTASRQAPWLKKAFARDRSRTHVTRFEWLIADRFLQGIGGAAVGVVPRAVIRDRHTGVEATRLMALVMLVIAVSPMLAPLVPLVPPVSSEVGFVCVICMSPLSPQANSSVEARVERAKKRIRPG